MNMSRHKHAQLNEQVTGHHLKYGISLNNNRTFELLIRYLRCGHHIL